MERNYEAISVYPEFSYFYNQVKYTIKDKINSTLARGSIKRNFWQSLVYKRFPCFAKTICKIESAIQSKDPPVTIARPNALLGRTIEIRRRNNAIYGRMKSNLEFTKFYLNYKGQKICQINKSLKEDWSFIIYDDNGHNCGSIFVGPGGTARFNHSYTYDCYEVRVKKNIIPEALVVPTFVSLHMFFCFPWRLPIGKRGEM